MRHMRKYEEIDPLAALQHEIRDAAHDTGGLYAYLDSIAVLGQRGVYDLEEVLAHVRGAACRAAIMNGQFNRDKRSGTRAEEELEKISAELKEMRVARMAKQGRDPDGVYLKCSACGCDLNHYKSQVYPPLCRYCDPEAETE